MGRLRVAMRSPLVLFPLLFLARSAYAADEFKNTFDLYPAGSRDCLQTSADSSGCAGDDSVQMNGCLCANGGNFILGTAKCIGKESPDDLTTVWTQLTSNCNDSNTQVTIKKAEFMEAGEEGKAEATATTATTPNTPTNTGADTTSTSGAADDDDSGSLGIGAIVGIAVGGVVAFAAVVAGAFIFIRRGRAKRHAREEAHPMLPSHLSPSTGPSPSPGPGLGPQPTHMYATSPSTVSELPTTELAPVAAVAASPGWNKANLSPSPGPGTDSDTNKWSMYSTPSAVSPNPSQQWGPQQPGWNQHASWMSGASHTPPPPPGYAYSAQYGGNVYEMPNTPSAAYNANAGPAPVEMDATQQPSNHGSDSGRP